MHKKVKRAENNVPSKVETTSLFQDMEKCLMEMEKQFEDVFPGK